MARTLELKLNAPAGKPMNPDEELERRVKTLPPSAPLEEYFAVFECWKAKAIARSKEKEQKAPSIPVGTW